MKMLRKMLYALRRKFDMAVLWPSFKDMAHSLDEARVMLIVHARCDAAWNDRYTTEEKLVAFVKTLR